MLKNKPSKWFKRHKLFKLSPACRWPEFAIVQLAVQSGCFKGPSGTMKKGGGENWEPEKEKELSTTQVEGGPILEMNLTKSSVYMFSYVLNYVLNLLVTPLPPLLCPCSDRTSRSLVPRSVLGMSFPPLFFFPLFHKLYSLKILSLKTAFGGMRLCQFPCTKPAFLCHTSLLSLLSTPSFPVPRQWLAICSEEDGALLWLPLAGSELRTMYFKPRI